MQVIPAIDVQGGRCVRLLQGRFEEQTAFCDDPVAVARRWASFGPAWIHVIDLDGAREGQPRHLELVRHIVEAVESPVEVGGGIRDMGMAESALAAGAQRVVIGPAALEAAPVEAYAARFGERLVIALDAKDGKLRTHGWQVETRIDAFAFARELAARGVQRLMFTDIARDGAMAGPNVESVRRMVEAAGIPVIASGGVSSVEDVRRLRETGCEGAIIGRALYTGDVELSEAITAGR